MRKKAISIEIDLGLSNRTEILSAALIIESTSSTYLALLLGINDAKNSKTLGNKSGCLSFNQKIDMLIEIGALSRIDKAKFQTFMEIRNQFMHNIEAKTYEKCFDFVPKDKETYLFKNYPQSQALSREEKLKAATKQLGRDVANLTFALKNKLTEKVRNEVEATYSKKSQEAFIKSIHQVRTELDEFFDKEIEKSPTFDSVRLKGFGTELSKTLLLLWGKNFKDLTKKFEEESLAK